MSNNRGEQVADFVRFSISEGLKEIRQGMVFEEWGVQEEENEKL